MEKKTQKTQTLVQWLIQKIDTKAYRSGTRTGMMHPEVDKNLVYAVGSLSELISQAKSLEEDEAFRGKFQVKWRSMRTDLEKMDFPVDIMEELCRREGIEDPRRHQLRCIEQIRQLREEADVDWLMPFYDQILERLEAGDRVQYVNKSDGRELDDMDYFRCLNAVASNQIPVWERIFSAAIFRDSDGEWADSGDKTPPSKRFKQFYKKRVVTTLSHFSPLYQEGMTEDEFLTAHGILSYAQTLEWKGPVRFRIDNGDEQDTSLMKYGTVLNAQMLDHAVPVSLPGVRRIMTIENKANYESMDFAEDVLYIYCHGFFSPRERKFLETLVKIAGDDVEYLHWGDMDYGGIRIFRFNREKIFPTIRPYRMGAEEFRRAVDQGAGVPLEPDKRKKLEAMDEGALGELRDCILESGLEIEQEMLLAADFLKR